MLSKKWFSTDITSVVSKAPVLLNCFQTHPSFLKISPLPTFLTWITKTGTQERNLGHSQLYWEQHVWLFEEMTSKQIHEKKLCIK